MRLRFMNSNNVFFHAVGNTYVNHWERASEMVSVEDASLEYGGFQLKQMIWNAARDTLQEWTGQQMAECSLYGVRVYKEGAVLAPHVDRLPLVSSAIINVAQDVDEPWYVVLTMLSLSAVSRVSNSQSLLLGLLK